MATSSSQSRAEKTKPYWVLYLSLLLSGLLLLADAYDFSHLDRWTARFGFALIYSAVALLITNGKEIGQISVGILWLTVVLTYIL